MDHLTDTSGRLSYRMAKEASLPAYALDHEPGDTSALAPDCFADRSGREFPVHTRADALLSAVCMSKFGAEAPADVRGRVDAAVRLWGLEDELKAALEPPAEKEAEEVFEVEYPLPEPFRTVVSTPADFEKVASDCTDASRYPLSVRRSVSQQLLRGVSRFSPSRELVQSLQKSAGWGVSPSSVVREGFRQRALLLYNTHRAESDRLEKAGEQVEGKWPEVVPYESLEKIAFMFDAVDRLSGLHRVYGRGLPRPEDCAFKYTLLDGETLSKQAVHLSNEVTLGAAEVERNFDRIRPLLEDAFAIVAGSAKEACEKLPSLTPRQADILIKALS